MNHSVGDARGPGITGAVLDALDGGVVLLDEDHHVLVWNSWMAHFSGIAATEVLGRDLASDFPNLVGTRLWRAIDDALTLGLSSLLTQGLNPSLLPLRHRDGRDLLHSIIVRRLPGQADGKALCLLQVSDVTASVERERLLRDRRDARHRAVVDTAADAIITTDPDGTIRWVNPAAERQFGYAAEKLEGERVEVLLGTDCAAWMKAASRLNSAVGATPIGVTGRRSDGSMVDLELSLSLWQSGGRIYATGILRDVTERKQAEEQQKLLMREVDHRAKNALAVVRSLLRLTRADDPKRFAETVEGRVAALARAHTLLAQDLWTGAGLDAVVEQELAAYRGGGRVVISGPPVRLAPNAVQPLSMALHELATNAAKYGALSALGGRVEVSWRVDRVGGGLHLRWAEHDGPPILMPPERRGFGSTLVEATVRGQLGGKAEIHWDLAGLRCEMTIAKDKLIRETAVAIGEPAGQHLEVEAAGDGVLGVSLRGRRVLVAEDEPIVAMELREVLARLGCEVLGPAATLNEALVLAAAEVERGIDAAVLDVNLHGRMIFPLVDLLTGRGVPVVYASGYGELPGYHADREKIVLLRKPVNDSDLEAALRQVIRGLPARTPDRPE